MRQRREATELPVAQVAVDVSLAHLDRPFDYLVPHSLADQARPGVRVRVRFSGRLVDGVVLARLERSGHDGRLGWLERVVSAQPVLSDELVRLCRTVADRQAGTFADVLRLAVPPRHARVEAEPVTPDAAGSERAGPPSRPEPTAGATTPGRPEPGYPGWERYQHGEALLAAVAGGRGPHAVWQPAPGEDWPARLAEVAAATVSSGRGALVVVPDQRDVARLVAAARVVALTADLGPARRYRGWLAVRRGRVRLVVGTRAAAFAPVADLGLLVVWDDGDDLHAEPRAPYPHARDVLVQRAHLTGAGLLELSDADPAIGGLRRIAVTDTGHAQYVALCRVHNRQGVMR